MPGRILALDVGSVRIGVALSGPMGMFASGLTVLPAKEPWMDKLELIIKEHEVSHIVVGLPVRTDGTDGPEVKKMLGVVEKLKKRFDGIAVETCDERFTTSIAEKALIEGDVSRKGRRERIDMVAATLLLQGYLESRRT